MSSREVTMRNLLAPFRPSGRRGLLIESRRMALNVFKLTVCVLWMLVDGLASCDAEQYAKPYWEEALASDESLLESLLDKEIQQTKAYLDQLHTKESMLKRMIDVLREDEDVQRSMKAFSNQGNRSRVQPPRTNHLFGDQAPPRVNFKDWFWPHSQWYLDGLASNSSPSIEVEMLSFHPNGNVQAGSRKPSSNPSHRKPLYDEYAMTHQFLMALDRDTARMNLFHPVTKDLVWQHQFREKPRITKLIIHDDRSNHLSLVTAAGELHLYKVRVYHGRRLVSGDYRRVLLDDSPLCHYTIGDQSSAREYPFLPSEIHAMQPGSAMPSGLHLHLEFELVSRTKPPFLVDQCAVVTHQQAVYVVTSNRDGRTAFLDGRNGSFISELPRSYGRIVKFKALASGVVAFATANRIHFVDALEQKLLNVACEGSASTITSLERDHWRHNILYAGTDNGRGLVFHINRFGMLKVNNGLIDPPDEFSRDMPSCALTAQLLPRRQQLAPQRTQQQISLVKALPGYLVLATESSVVLYGLNGGAPRHLAEKPLSLPPGSSLVSISAPNELLGSPIGLSLTYLVPQEANATSCRHHVELFSSLLPAPTSGLDFSWIRAPLMLICAVGVMLWQQQTLQAPARRRLDLLGAPGPMLNSDWSRGSISANQRSRRL